MTNFNLYTGSAQSSTNKNDADASFPNCFLQQPHHSCNILLRTANPTIPVRGKAFLLPL